MAYELGTYSKPGKPDRTARTASDAVQLTWDGYKHVKSEDAAPAAEVKSESVDATASAPSDAEKAAADKAEVEKTQPKPRAPRS